MKLLEGKGRTETKKWNSQMTIQRWRRGRDALERKGKAMRIHSLPISPEFK
jgi:hypothetical protein